MLLLLVVIIVAILPKKKQHDHYLKNIDCLKPVYAQLCMATSHQTLDYEN